MYIKSLKKQKREITERNKYIIIQIDIYNIHIIVNSKNNYLFSFIINTTEKCRCYVIIRNNIKKNPKLQVFTLCFVDMCIDVK